MLVAMNTNHEHEALMQAVAKGFQEVHELIHELAGKVDGLNTGVADTRSELSALGKEVRQGKLELLDKLASKERVDDHELRIQHLETLR